MSSSIQHTIESLLSEAEPSVEVLLAEVGQDDTLKLIVDHPDGVTLDLCARVTRSLEDLREKYAIEVSSPGIERPLTKPEHFRRFIGSRARIRVRDKIAASEDAEPRRSFVGELMGADDDAVTLGADGGLISVPYAQIQRSNLVEE